VLWSGLAAGKPAGESWSPDDADPSFFAAAIGEDYRPNQNIPRNLVHFLDRGSLLALDAALQAVDSAGLGAGAGDSRRFAVVDGLPYRAPGQPTIFVPYGHLVARALGVRGSAVSLAGRKPVGPRHRRCRRMVRRVTLTSLSRVQARAFSARSLVHLSLMRRQLPMPIFDAGTPVRPARAPLPGDRIPSPRARAWRDRRSPHRGHRRDFDSAVEPLASATRPSWRTMQAALAAAGYLQNQVDLFVAGADGRQSYDFADGYGAMRTFGRHAYFAGVTTIAGSAGQSLAAGGPLSLVAAIEAMRRQAVFPIGGFETPETDVELAYVRAARPERVDCVMVSAGRGRQQHGVSSHSLTNPGRQVCSTANAHTPGAPHDRLHSPESRRSQIPVRRLLFHHH